MSLAEVLLEAGKFAKSELNLEIQKSTLKFYPSKLWNEFCQKNKKNLDLNQTEEGIYLPGSYEGHINADSHAAISNAFHELYGHGLFCEHSTIGKPLVQLANDGEESGKYLHDEISESQLLGLAKRNFWNYEGFALWMESLLCTQTQNQLCWTGKKNKLPKDYFSTHEVFCEMESNLGRFGFLKQMGFPQPVDNKKIVETLKRLYAQNYSGIEFAVLYGSQKPDKDIDLFIVSNNQPKKYFNGWLDIYEINMQEFEYLSSMLDISITDPIFSGVQIIGESGKLQALRQLINSQPITQESIIFNHARSEEQLKNLSGFPNWDKRRKDCASYIESYSQNALHLAKGEKLLTLNRLKNAS